MVLLPLGRVLLCLLACFAIDEMQLKRVTRRNALDPRNHNDAPGTDQRAPRLNETPTAAVDVDNATRGMEGVQRIATVNGSLGSK